MIFHRLLVSAVILCTVAAACGKHENNGVRMSGSLLVNGPAMNGSVQVNSKRLYLLPNIIAGNEYTLRTVIAAGGTLAGDVHASEQDYLNSVVTTSLTMVVSDPTYTYTTVYETYFNAPASGNYIIALSGTPSATSATKDSLFFYDLQLLSSTVTTSFATAPTTTTAIAENTATITAGYSHIYSGATVTPSGVYTVSLRSQSTTTAGNPQMFIFADSMLKTSSLLYSSHATSIDYQITTFATPTTAASLANEIANVPFSATGPFILLKGTTSIQYTITVH